MTKVAVLHIFDKASFVVGIQFTSFWTTCWQESWAWGDIRFEMDILLVPYSKYYCWLERSTKIWIMRWDVVWSYDFYEHDPPHFSDMSLIKVISAYLSWEVSHSYRLHIYVFITHTPTNMKEKAQQSIFDDWKWCWWWVLFSGSCLKFKGKCCWESQNFRNRDFWIFCNHVF